MTSDRIGSDRGAYLGLFVLLFLGWGVLSPFLPAVLAVQGASASQIGLLLGLGVVVRLVAMPVAGRLADLWDRPRQVLAALLAAAGLAALGYGLALGFLPLLLVGVLHAVATGPMGPLPDALAVRSAAAGRLDYGIVRGAGAAAFILANALAGWLAGMAGSPLVLLWLNAGLCGLAAVAALRLPPPARAAVPAGTAAAGGPGTIRALFALPEFRRLLLVSGLVQGSHALYLGFATLRWQAAGIAPGVIGLLWSLSVAAEVLVFFWLGRPLLARLGPGRLCALAAAAGLLRWGLMAVTDAVPVLLLAQPLHGLTYAAQHLAAMAVLARVAAPDQAATAQSLHASLGAGAWTAALLLVSGPLYEALGGSAFWVMAAASALAVPLALGLGHAPVARLRPATAEQ
ncbi:MFS transporter [Paeniroseomonas aquatica]|uniref:MFS transporter n=1 Tax=Paeniroseomonas aquatica TaxID=373043 RepID=A0ABT8A555_9PROT|nr:MFS transporter [Paeniroseomonas aquatica]MDN3564915.1 MFS transporter [Paeniroseomonas aquatica]